MSNGYYRDQITNNKEHGEFLILRYEYIKFYSKSLLGQSSPPNKPRILTFLIVDPLGVFNQTASVKIFFIVYNIEIFKQL